MADAGQPWANLPPEYFTATRAPQYLASCIAPLIVASSFVVARIYTRSILTKGWGNDDTAIVIAWLFSISLTIVSAMTTQYGNGKHIYAIPISEAVTGTKLIYSCRFLYLLVIFACKTAFCASYLRIFSDRGSRKFLWAIMVYTVVTAVPIIILTAVPCLPVYHVWDMRYTKACFTGTKNIVLTYLWGMLNVVGDLMLLAFVVPRLLPLKMPRQQKVILMSIVSLSVLIIISALLRMVRVAKENSSDDPTWTLVDVALWSGIEVNTALVVVSAPAIKPLVRRILPFVLGRTALGRSQTGYEFSRNKTHPSRAVATVASIAVDERGFRLGHVAEGGTGDVKWVDQVSQTRTDDTDSEREILGSRKA